jgi:1,2-diacylglycerol 3-alpha-glucosyltransferase
MRIAMFTNTYKPAINGVVVSISLFYKGLQAAGHDVHLLAPKYDEKDVEDEPFVFRFPAIDLSELVAAALPLPIKALLEPTVSGLQPEIIHAHHPLLMGDLAADFAEERGIPLVFTFHTRLEEYAEQYAPFASNLIGSLVDQMVHRYLKRCTHVIAPSASAARMIAKIDPDVPVTVLPTPVDLSIYKDLHGEEVRRAYGLEQNEVLLYIGRLSKEKNLPFLFEAFAQIHSTRSNTRLLVVGFGPLEASLKEWAAKHGLSEAIVFTGSVQHKKIPHYAAAGDLFLFSSNTETQGLVLIEAMAAGTPVVSVKGMGQDEALSQGGGVIVEEDLNEFTQQVVALLADKQSLQRLAGEARTAVKRFSVANSVEALVQVYQQALEDFSNRPENNSKKDQIKVEAVLPGFEETLFLGDKHLWR